MTQQTTQPAQAAQGDPAEILQMVDTLLASMTPVCVLTRRTTRIAKGGAMHGGVDEQIDATHDREVAVALLQAARRQMQGHERGRTGRVHRNARSAQGEPKVNIKAETCSNGVTGTTYLNVVRIEVEDDGSLTAVTDAAIAASGRQE